jgi:hypothetical protein
MSGFGLLLCKLIPEPHFVGVVPSLGEGHETALQSKQQTG